MEYNRRWKVFIGGIVVGGFIMTFLSAVYINHYFL
jgi:hypothetical protein